MLDYGVSLSNYTQKIFDRENKNHIESHYKPNIEKLLFFNVLKLIFFFNISTY